MTGHHASRLWIGLWTALALAGCGSDGPAGEELNLEEQQISTADDRYTVEHPVAMGPDGRFAVAWDGGAGMTRIRMQRFAASGFKDGPLLSMEGSPSDFQVNSDVAIGPQGEIFVTWVGFNLEGTRTQIHGQRFSADGVALGAAFIVQSSPDVSTFLCGVDVGPAGQAVVQWVTGFSEPNNQLWIRRFAADGSAAGSDQLFASEPDLGCMHPPAVQADGSFAVVRTLRNQSWVVQRFAASGLTTGALINLDALATGGRAGAPMLNATPGGGFVAIWSTSDSNSTMIEGQRFAADGALLSGRFQVAQGSAAGSLQFSVGPDGSMAVAWDSDRGITARRLAPDGTPLGAEIPVCSGCLGPAIALGPLGRFFVTWVTSPAPPNQVRGRLFSE